MSFFGKVQFGNDADLEAVQEIKEAFESVGLETNLKLGDGRIYFNRGEEE